MLSPDLPTMSEGYATLPFFFRRLPDKNSIFISNQAGAFSLLDNNQQLKSLVNNDYQSVPENKFEELVSKSIIGEAQDYSVRLNAVGSKFATSIQQTLQGPGLFIIVPTLRCDHNCRYCQVSRVSLNKQGYDLGRQSIGKIISIISKSNSDSVKIEFQGGEPLVAIDYIKDFVASAQSALRGKELSFVICSALGPLTQNIIDWAKANNITFSVSLDGNEKIHAANRPSRYFNSYSNTTSRTRLLRGALGTDKVSCLSTVTKHTLHSPEDFVGAYFYEDLENIFIRPLSPFGFAAHKLNTLGYTAEEFFSFYKKCMALIFEYNQQRCFIEDTARIHLTKLYRPKESGYVDLQSPAGYLLGALVFNYDGKVFGSDEARMLYESTKSDELILGHIDSNPEDIYRNNHAEHLLADTFLSCAPGCDECAYQPFCGADPLHHLATQGEHIGHKAHSFFCKLERMQFDYIVSLLQSKSHEKDILLSWLNR